MITLKDSVVAKYSGKDFSRIANQQPEIWGRIAVVLSKR